MRLDEGRRETRASPFVLREHERFYWLAGGRPTARAASTRCGTGPAMGADSLTIRAATCAALRFGYRARTSAAVPATSGVAIEVPLHVPYSLSGTLLKISWPGAARSTHDPRVEKSARLSAWVLAATASTTGWLSAAGYS